MKQLSTYRFYELGARLHGLLGAECGTRATDMFGPLTEIQAMLDGFIKGESIAFSTSKDDATKLLNKIGSIFNRYFIDPSTKQLKKLDNEDRIDAHEFATLRGLVEKFEHALAAELNRAPAYATEKCGIYSTYDLAENAHEMFAENLRQILPPAALSEFSLAGRALAFGLATAAVVHMLRSVEMTLRSYYEVFVGGTPVTKAERNYSIYIKKLAALAEEDDNAKRPDKRVIQMLAQIKERYRNPLVVADAAMSMDEAMQLFGMSSALISMMAEVVASNRRSVLGASHTASDPCDGDLEEQ